MKNFCDINCLKSLIKVPTYFRNHDKSTFWPHTNKSAQIYSNTAMLLKLQSFDSNWIQNGISKLKPKIIAYRDYKNFDNAKFTHDIVTPTTNLDNFGTSKSTIFNIFDRHDPIKKKYIRANEASFMSKELHTAIMKRSRNIFLQHRTDTNKKTIAPKEISVKKLLKNTKKSNFENLDT